MIDPSPTSLAAQIVAAYASGNDVDEEAHVGLIGQVVGTLERLVAPLVEASPPERPPPAVPIRMSVFRDHVVCLEDGKTFKTLKRHLFSDHGMTPEQYRKRWKLPDSYPITAPDYAQRRSVLAKEFRLGKPPDKEG